MEITIHENNKLASSNNFLNPTKAIIFLILGIIFTILTCCKIMEYPQDWIQIHWKVIKSLKIKFII